MHKYVLFCLPLLLLTQCASQQRVFGVELHKTRLRFNLKSPAVVSARVFPNKPSDCSGALKTVKAKIVSEKKEYAMKKQCDSKGNVFFVSSGYIPKGAHSLRIEHSSSRHFNDKLLVHARFENADFSSDKDGIAEGALSLEDGTGAEGSVSYYDGDASDYYQVKGKKTNATLTLLTSDPVRAIVYRKMGKQRKTLAVLKPNKGSEVTVYDDDVYIQVQSPVYSTKGTYTLLRKDSTLVETVSVSVIDVYPVSNSSAVIMLEAVDGMAKDGLIDIYSNEGAKVVALGKCKILNVDGDQASCRMAGPAPQDAGKLRAKAVLGG